ncbi:unnamed protein product [Blepharisma stoltei]|uniref:Tyrosine-protein kinase ephrin type A/B receptor-like domain-containing protein n=1 Tax=Blepharisma stoltei TaxID=1481888 RepID=A0AAU9INM3_9CILI|nr:unnamed protein product [Blepharisma stoltei]
MGQIIKIFLYILSCSQTYSISFTRIPAMDSPPSKREYALLAYNNETDNLIVFGGNLDVSIVYNDVWSFSLETKTWSNLVPLSQISPIPRIFFGGFVDSVKNKLYIFGGLTLNGPLNDMWSYDLKSLQWNSIKQKGDIPSSRYRFGYTSYYDTVDRKLKFALYGGCLPFGYDNNLFIFNVENSTWTLQNFQKVITPKLDFALIEHLNGFIYMCGGIEKESSNPFNQKFFRYDIHNNLWENITNSLNTYTSTYYAGSAIIGTNFYLLYGWSEEFYGDIENIMTVDLSDHTYEWKYVNPITADTVSFPIIRDSLSFASKPGSFYMFGGYSASLGIILNNMIEYTLNGTELEYKFISPEYLSPSVRERHSLNAIYDKLYLFGGRNQTLLLNDFWVFYPEKEIWEPVFLLGNNPPPRSGHGSDSKGDILVIFGGEGYAGYSNDLYVYNVLSNQWSLIEPSSSDDVPTPRTGSCAKIYFPYIFIFGGLALAGYSNELWIFDISTYTYTLVYDGTDEGPAPSAFSSCKIEIDDSENILFFTFYGTGKGEAPLGDVDYFNFTSNKWTNVYTTNYETPITNRANAVVQKVSDKIIVMGGDLWAIDVYKDIFILDLKEKSFIPLGLLPDYIYRAAYVYYKNNIYIHGGGSMYGHSMRILVGKNSFVKVDFEGLDFECSPGFFDNNGECQLCGPGSYTDFYGMASCIPCPEGTYNPSYGLNSYSQCYPCPENTFSNEIGSSACKKCPAGKICLTGSVSPLDQSNYLDKESIQPDLYTSGSLISASSTILNLSLSFVVFLFLLISIEKLRKEIAKIDIYDEMHNYVNDSVMILRRTKIGGVFTAIFIFLAFLLASYEIGSYINTNVQEMKHFIPLTTLWDQISTFSANITVSVIVYGYGDSCGSDKVCSDLTEFSFQYISYSSYEIYCAKNNEGSCIINVVFTNSELSYGSHLELTFKEKFSYASAFKVNVTSTSSIPDEISSMYQSLSANKSTVFRGPSPSQFHFSLIPSYFMSEISSWPSKLTGYHVSIIEAPEEGSEVNIISLPFSAGLKINVWLDKRENCLFTTRSQKMSFNMLASILIGSIFGIVNGAGGAMKKFEMAYHEISGKIKNKKKATNLKQRRENYRNMLNSNVMEHVNFDGNEAKSDIIYTQPLSLESFNY